MAFENSGGWGQDASLQILDIRRGSRTAIRQVGYNIFPIWGPDNQQITFASNRAGSWDIYTAMVDESDDAQVLLTREFHQYPMSWSLDGQTLAYIEINPSSGYDIWTLSAGSDPPEYLVTPSNEHSPQFSPDGQWIAYVSNESGRDEVYLRSFPEAERRRAISTSGGTEPRWSRDGGELYLALLTSKWVEVQVGATRSYAIWAVTA